MKVVNLKLINNRRGRGSEKKPSAVEVRLTYDRSVKYITTGVRVCTNQWQSEKVVRHPDAEHLNLELSMLVTKIRGILARQRNAGFVDLEAVSRMLEMTHVESFWDYVELRSAKRPVSDATKVRYETFLKQLKKFDKFKTFSEITPAGIRSFDEFLHEKKYKPRTIYSYHKMMRIFIKDAIIDGYLTQNAYVFGRIKVPRGDDDETLEKYLEEEELDKLRKCAVTEMYLARVRDVFLFACNTGLSWSDLDQFDYRLAVKEGKYMVVRGKRTKNGKEYIVVLLPEAEKILKRYNYHLPIISNVKYNLYLRALCVRSGIDKKVTSHWARHTAAMRMLNNGVPIEVVSKVLGHSNTLVTQKVYAKVLAKTVVREISAHMKNVK